MAFGPFSHCSENYVPLAVLLSLKVPCDEVFDLGMPAAAYPLMEVALWLPFVVYPWTAVSRGLADAADPLKTGALELLVDPWMTVALGLLVVADPWMTVARGVLVVVDLLKLAALGRVAVVDLLKTAALGVEVDVSE